MYSVGKVMLNNVVANGHSERERVENASHIGLTIAADGTTPTFNVRVKGSVQPNVDFTLPASPSNQWDYLALIDLDDRSSIVGATGVAFAGTAGVRMLEVNVNGVYEIALEVSARTNGNAHAFARQFILE